jgi:hypothetical protein
MKQDDAFEHMEKPEEIIDDIVSGLDTMHQQSVDDAVRLGYARDVYKALRPQWAQLGATSASDPQAAAVYSSGVGALSAFRDQVRAGQQSLKPMSGIVQAIAGSANYAATSTSTTTTFVAGFYPTMNLPEPKFFSPTDVKASYAVRFARFDESLGRTYQEIWEALYGTRADPERAALYLIRQAFDQLFAKLAPDDEVRRSSYWKAKKGDKPNQVYRPERIAFAAGNHVKDKGKADILLASAKHMLDVYKALNAAHDRGQLNRDKAVVALREMEISLQMWADALDI